MCITRQDVKSKPDFEATAKVIERFILEVDYSYVDDLNQYEKLKTNIASFSIGKMLNHTLLNMCVEKEKEKSVKNTSTLDLSMS